MTVLVQWHHVLVVSISTKAKWRWGLCSTFAAPESPPFESPAGHVLGSAVRSGCLLPHIPTPGSGGTLAAKVENGFTELWMLQTHHEFIFTVRSHTDINPHPLTSWLPPCLIYSLDCPCQWTWRRGPGSAWRVGPLMNTVSPFHQRCTCGGGQREKATLNTQQMSHLRARSCTSVQQVTPLTSAVLYFLHISH